jgi:hypothetical protein
VADLKKMKEESEAVLSEMAKMKEALASAQERYREGGKDMKRTKEKRGIEKTKRKRKQDRLLTKMNGRAKFPF